MSAAGALTHKKKVLLKVVVLGDSGVGKTSVINKYVKRQFNAAYRATIGSELLSRDVVIDDRLVTLQIWDTAGQERFQGLGTAFYRGSDACVLTYDLTDAKSFGNLTNWMDEFLTHCAPTNPDSFPFVVMGNKADAAVGSKRAVTEADAKQWCASKGVGGAGAESGGHFEVSAKDGANIDQAFQAIAVAALKASDANAGPALPPIKGGIKVDDTPAPADKGCCP